MNEIETSDKNDLIKFQNRRSLIHLTEKELIRETYTPQKSINIYLYEDDLMICKTMNVNLSRLCRFLIHDWLQHQGVTFL